MPTAQWERQPGESSEAFRAFAVYRDQGPDRSLAETSRLVARSPGARKSRLSFEGAASATKRHQKPGYISAWSRKYQWVERASAWDDYLDKQRLKRSTGAIEKMAERHARQTELAAQALMAPILAFARAIQDKDRSLAFERAPLNDLLELALSSSRFLPKIQEAERISRGVRIEKLKDDAGGGHEWVVRVHQPAAPLLQTEEAEVGEPPEWDGDPGGEPREDD